MLKSALKKSIIELYSDGNDTRSFCYVSDAISLILRILLSEKISETAFNVGNDKREISIRDVAKLFVKLTDNLLKKKIRIVYKKSKDTHYLSDNPRRRKPNISLAKKKLNWKPKEDLVKGLTRTLKSYL